MFAQHEPDRLKPEPHDQQRGNPWLSQNWGLLVMAGAAVGTIIVSAGTQVESSARPNHFPPVAHQTLFSVNSGVSAVAMPPSAASYRNQGRSRVAAALGALGRHRTLQENGEVLDKPVVEYETQLELFMCNPTLVTEGNDAYIVGTAELANALSRVHGLKQVDASEITVSISTAPSDDTEAFYKCEDIGMLQWHASIKYPAATAESLDTTCALMAAQANDYVAYSKDEFKELLTGYINDEYATSTDSENVELVPSDIVAPVVGWIVTFSEEGTTTQTASDVNSNGIAAGIEGDYVMWSWWVWLLYLLLVTCCLFPLCCVIFERRNDEDKIAPQQQQQPDTTREGRKEEGLKKIRGPEWGITELDFEEDYKNYQSPEMKQEYVGANKGIQSTGYRASRPGHQSISDTAWMQQAGKKSEWAQPSPSSPSSGSGTSPTRVRRFDIDEDADGSVGRLREKHPKYSFDMNAGRRAGAGGARVGASTNETKL